jgi:hypothetical protein
MGIFDRTWKKLEWATGIAYHTLIFGYRFYPWHGMNIIGNEKLHSKSWIWFLLQSLDLCLALCYGEDLHSLNKVNFY